MDRYAIILLFFSRLLATTARLPHMGKTTEYRGESYDGSMAKVASLWAARAIGRITGSFLAAATVAQLMKDWLRRNHFWRPLLVVALVVIVLLVVREIRPRRLWEPRQLHQYFYGQANVSGVEPPRQVPR
jgi:hypothetical protein